MIIFSGKGKDNLRSMDSMTTVPMDRAASTLDLGNDSQVPFQGDRSHDGWTLENTVCVILFENPDRLGPGRVLLDMPDGLHDWLADLRRQPTENLDGFKDQFLGEGSGDGLREALTEMLKLYTEATAITRTVAEHETQLLATHEQQAAKVAKLQGQMDTLLKTGRMSDERWRQTTNQLKEEMRTRMVRIVQEMEPKVACKTAKQTECARAALKVHEMVQMKEPTCETSHEMEVHKKDGEAPQLEGEEEIDVTAFEADMLAFLQPENPGDGAASTLEGPPVCKVTSSELILQLKKCSE